MVIFSLRYKNVFWKKVEKTESCWLWKGHLSNNGYSKTTLYFEGTPKTYLGHRVSWMYHFGEIPKGMQVCHKCDVRNCVNPQHLFLGTRKDNQDDMMSKGRQTIGSRNGRARVNESIVLEMRKLFESGVPARVLMKKYGTSRTRTYDMLNGKSWSHV